MAGPAQSDIERRSYEKKNAGADPGDDDKYCITDRMCRDSGGFSCKMKGKEAVEKITKKQQRYLKVRQVQKEQRTQIKLQFGIL